MKIMPTQEFNVAGRTYRTLETLDMEELQKLGQYRVIVSTSPDEEVDVTAHWLTMIGEIIRLRKTVSLYEEFDQNRKS